jgi:hypothetical protein
MDSADQTMQTLVHADGYSYTEIFQAPALPGVPGNNRLISVFHSFFTPEGNNLSSTVQLAAGPHSETCKASGEIV